MTMSSTQSAHFKNHAWFENYVSNFGSQRRTHVQAATITPEVAAEMLKRNEGNRNPRHQHVTLLSRAMEAGQWIDTGDTIKFDTNGRLLDGQHRLLAVLQSKTPVRMDVAFGIDPEAFDRIDTGYSRTTGQLLSMAGVKDGAVVTSAVRTLMAIEAGFRAASSLSVSRHDVVEYFKRNPGVADCVKQSNQIKHALGRTTSPGGVAAAIFIIKYADGQDLNTFIDNVCSGIGLVKDSSLLLLRNRLIRGSSRQGDGVEVAAIFIKAFNSWREGRPMQKLVWRVADEEFPTVVGN